ncbi:MAG: hypothetical protein GEU76_03275 [Alphaproteobacteria bacterium]|nr:hypothetical protein [Alphaproteobacteria bacterium]
MLGVLAKRARRIFEFGTCTGRTAYLLGRNAPHNAEIITLTLSPETAAQYQADEADPDSARWERIAKRESAHLQFLYEGTDAAEKILQIFGDSKEFDAREIAGTCDLVFIDGSHAYSYVASDSDKAFAMVAPGGFIAWHDFSPACPGVWRCLNEIATNHRLFHIKGTRLVLYRHPA